ncbi:MAG TPA: endo alpha-1,4 polygalactosaminidase [Bacillota bacterium]|nr:endo alpha-1,4 polygalactosaminidase [Bacillota bacterium]
MKRVAIVILFLFILILSGCFGSGNPGDNSGGGDTQYRRDMRQFVQGISDYARGIQTGFIVIPQNGGEILTVDGDPTGTPVAEYISAIDGVGREDLFYGYDNDDTPTSTADRNYLIPWMDLARSQGLTVLVTDYCSTPGNMDDSYTQNHAKGYLSFAADDRELRDIPGYPATPHEVNTANINTLSDAKNFLYLLNPENYNSTAEFIAALDNTNYDLIILDLDFNGNALTATDLTSLKTKLNGGKRLLIAYMSIGEAEDYRYYWNHDWGTSPPAWIDQEDPNWTGNYWVRYWDPDWQQIIYGNDQSYLKKIIDAGFDGVYLDIIDAFEHFEN